MVAGVFGAWVVVEHPTSCGLERLIVPRAVTSSEQDQVSSSLTSRQRANRPLRTPGAAVECGADDRFAVSCCVGVLVDRGA